jgi:hypothetical protein
MDDTKIKFCVLVSYDESYKRMASYTVEKNIRKYCELHGYDLHIDYQEKFSNGKPTQWQKIRAARELLETHKYDWVFYLDTDCLIMNPNIKLESFVDDDCSFIVPKHGIKAVDTPTSEGNIISSQFFVRNDECGIDILDEIWLSQGNDKVEEFDYEGRQIRIIINDGKYKNRIKLVEEKRLNTFWYVNNPFMVFIFHGINDNIWQKGDFIVHVTGYKTEERVIILSDLNYFSGLNYKNEIS